MYCLYTTHSDLECELNCETCVCMSLYLEKRLKGIDSNPVTFAMRGPVFRLDSCLQKNIIVCLFIVLRQGCLGWSATHYGADRTLNSWSSFSCFLSAGIMDMCHHTLFRSVGDQTQSMLGMYSTNWTAFPVPTSLSLKDFTIILSSVMGSCLIFHYCLSNLRSRLLEEIY